MILGGRHRPGERLVEESLSAELGVSRVPVREALLALSAQGLVHIEPRRGATVAAVTPKIVAELVEVRALLEGLNARLAAQRHDPEIVAELRAFDSLRAWRDSSTRRLSRHSRRSWRVPRRTTGSDEGGNSSLSLSAPLRSWNTA